VSIYSEVGGRLYYNTEPLGVAPTVASGPGISRFPNVAIAPAILTHRISGVMRLHKCRRVQNQRGHTSYIAVVEFGGGAEQCNGTLELFQLRWKLF